MSPTKNQIHLVVTSWINRPIERRGLTRKRKMEWGKDGEDNHNNKDKEHDQEAYGEGGQARDKNSKVINRNVTQNKVSAGNGGRGRRKNKRKNKKVIEQKLVLCMCIQSIILILGLNVSGD